VDPSRLAAARYEIVPTVPRDLFREHLTAMGELGRFASLGSLMNDPADAGEPLRCALTFDDDYATHVSDVLPVLRDFNLHGTFFLSGRSGYGLGGYWFQRLEALVARSGLPGTNELLDLPGVAQGAQLPLRCEEDMRRQTHDVWTSSKLTHQQSAR
jgi:hypothetical protein